MPKNKKFVKKSVFKLGNRIFFNVNKNAKAFYNLLESFMGLANKRIYIYPEIKRMNKIMRNYYKSPNLQIRATDNLIPINFKTEDGITIAGLQYITDPKSDKWIVSMHWFAGHKYWALYQAKPFIDLGYNIMVFDFRNHGDSQNDSYVTMGVNEVKDFRAAMKKLHEDHKPKTIGLMGMSMGAFTLNYGIVKYNEEFSKYNIKFAISDSFYGSINSLLLHTRNIWLKKLVSYKKTAKAIRAIVEQQVDATSLDWKDLDIYRYYKQEDIKHVYPIFFTHCRNDKVTPFDDSLKLFIDRSIYSRDDEILIFDYSKHCLSLKYHYNQSVYRWLMFENKIMKNDEATTKALATLGITQEIIDNNFEEKYELNTFYLNSSKDLNKKYLKGRKDEIK